MDLINSSYVRRRILFVCTANICRSPMAEAVLRKLCAKAGVAADIDSAATHRYMIGMPPFPLAVAIAKARGFDITRIIAREITQEDFERFDVILGMDRRHVGFLRAVAPPDLRSKVHLLLKYGKRYRNRDVPDPYNGAAADFELALDMIEDGCLGVLASCVLSLSDQFGLYRDARNKRSVAPGTSALLRPTTF